MATVSFAAIGGFVGCDEEPPTGACVRKGHDYGNTGVCVRCEEKAKIPAVASKQKFPLVEPCTHDKYPCPLCDYPPDAGEDKWNRLELKEGCYTVEIGSKGELWLSFSVEAAGQYALHSVGGANGVTASRHAANDSYVNEQGISAVVEENNFYAYDNCGESYFNSFWRSTYCLKGTVGTRVKIRFIRIADPAWEPDSIHTVVHAMELTQKAENAPVGKALVDVPYDSEYFYDESMGYYRMGTKEAPGEIIYAAINKEAPRLFNEGTSFRNLRQGSPTALNLNDGVTEDGDYNVLCYTPFIMNWVDENAIWYGENNYGFATTEPVGNPDKKCYQNYCNDDGVYPVNKELHAFLTLYTKLNMPVDEAVTSELWSSGTASDYLWLSACYYYAEQAQGTAENPHILTVGSNDATAKLNYFYKLSGEGSYTLSSDSPNVYIKIQGQSGVPLAEATVSGTDVFELYIDGAPLTATEITVTVTTN